MSQATCSLVAKNLAWTTHRVPGYFHHQALTISAINISFLYLYSSSRCVIVLHTLLAQSCFRKIGMDAFGIAD
jgi:hypothetical protein